MLATYPTINRHASYPAQRQYPCWQKYARAIVVGALLSFPSFSYSADPDVAAARQFQAFATKSEAQLSQVKSYTVKGVIKVTSEDPVLKANGQTREMKRTFSIWGQGSRLKETVVSLDDAGKTARTVTYYLDAKRVTIDEDAAGEAYRVAKMFTLGPRTGLFNECAAFMELSFLRIAIQPGGIPALLPADLGSSEKWAEVVRSVQSATIDEHGLLQVRLVSDAGSALIDLLPQSDSSTGYRIKAISFDGEYFSRKIEVLDYFRDPQFGIIGKVFKVSVYQAGPEQGLLATWELAIKDLQLNSPVDDELFTFDPSSVDMIYDGDTEQAIRVPK